ncbi:unnamed protein product [Bathycoccus prasinos]
MPLFPSLCAPSWSSSSSASSLFTTSGSPLKSSSRSQQTRRQACCCLMTTKTETEKTLLKVNVFSKKERTRSLKSKSILVMKAVSSSSSFRDEEEDDDLEDEDEEDEYYSFDDGEDFERAQQRERVGQRTSDRQRARLATGFGKGRKNASSSSSSSLSSSRDDSRLAALIDGGEVFFLSTAVAMKARQVYVEQRARAENENASVASSSGGALMDLPLYLAVVVGAVLRRASTSASGSGMFSSVFASGDKVKFPRAVNVRVQNLEVGLERLDENQRRYSRDVSRLGTRVRLTRRELSPMIRRAEATSIAFGEVAAELAKRIEVAEEEGSKLAETMASLHAVSAKQFEVLSKSVRELRAAMKELEMEAEEAAMMTSEEIASRKTNGIINSSRFAKKEELEKLERMLTEALEEMEDCLTTMVREKAIALGEEIDDISLMKDDSDVNDDEEREEEKNKELVWVGESSAQKKKSALLESKSQNAGKRDDDDEKKIAAENEPPTIQLYKFDEFNSSSSSRSSNSSSSSTDDESGTRRDGGDVSKSSSFIVRAEKPPQVDRTTGFIESDNTGMGNIFAVEPKQLYTESPTSDKYAKVGLGGIPGAILAVVILAGVFFGVQTLGSFEEVNNEFAGYDGESVSYYSEKFSS